MASEKRESFDALSVGLGVKQHQEKQMPTQCKTQRRVHSPGCNRERWAKILLAMTPKRCFFYSFCLF